MKFKIIASLLVFLLIASLVSPPTISGLKEDSSSYGNLMIDNDILSTTNHPLLLKIFGEVFNPVSDNKVTLIILKPDSSSVAIILSLDDSGTFYANHGINPNWPLGDYSIKATYQDNEIGILSFEITDEPITVPSDPQQEPTDTTTEPTDTTTEPTDTTTEPTDTTTEPTDTTTEPTEPTDTTTEPTDTTTEPTDTTTEPTDTTTEPTDTTTEPIDTTTEPTDTTTEPTDTTTTPKITYKETDRSIQTISESVLVPAWVKHNAKWWADDVISDNDFTSGIEFMIKQDIINVPQIISEKEKSSFTLGKIPTWIKSNAKWWAEDLISDEDFVKGIEFLIKEEIIRI